MATGVDALEGQIAEWRAFVGRGKAIAGADVEELEGHLRDQIEALTAAGLAADEAFLVAVKRLGSVSALSAEFAREHSDRLWRQLVLTSGAGAEAGEAGARPARSEGRVVLALAAAAAAAIKLPELFGIAIASEAPLFYMRNLSFFVLPFLALYLAWKRGLGAARCLRGRAPFAALERWQTGYLPVYSLWAVAVVLLFPLIFRFA